VNSAIDRVEWPIVYIRKCNSIYCARPQPCAPTKTLLGRKGTIWETEPPFSANATPATYEGNGRQFVVIAAGGQRDPGTPAGGGVYVAFALQQQRLGSLRMRESIALSIFVATVCFWRTVATPITKVLEETGAAPALANTPPMLENAH
jgi:hypothetical protein